MSNTTDNIPEGMNGNGKAGRGGNFVKKLKLRVVGDRMSLEAADGTEAFIRGAMLPGFLLRRPKLAAGLIFGLVVSGMGIVALVIAVIHILFGRPGSIAYKPTDITTWIPAASDRWLREPAGDLLNDIRQVRRESENETEDW